MRYLLGVDFGGGASKATLLREDGQFCASATTEYPTYYPKSGYVEQNPNDWIDASCKNIKSILLKSGVNPCDIYAVSFDGATHSAVITDDDFNVIRNTIYWTDTRSINEVNFLEGNYGEIIEKQVLHKPSTIWTLPQLMWIKNNERENWSKVKKILFAKDYVRHFFTGDYVTDYIEAEGSMIYDTTKGEWSSELCSILDIDKKMLPKIVNPTDIIGKISKKASDITGLCEDTLVICGTTDTVMEIFATGAVNKGQITLKLATAGRICAITDRAYPNTNLVNYSHISKGLYYPGTATKSCASSYRWFRDTFGGEYEKLDKGARDIPVGSDGLIFHPYLNGELTPYQNPNLCADFVGVRASHTKAHFARAVLEGVTMSMLDCIKTLNSMNITHDERALIIGGGAKSPFWRQMIADALGIELIQMKYTDSSFGSAMLAGVSVGIFNGFLDALEKCNKVISKTYPNKENTTKYNELFKKYKLVQKALEPIYNGEDI